MVPMAAYRSWRLKNRKLEPNWANAETELADSTMTNPSIVSTDTDATRASRARRMLRSARALAAAGVTSPRRTRRRWTGRMTVSLRMGPPGRRGQGPVPSILGGRGDRPGRGGEHVPSLGVIPKHVLAGTGRSEHDVPAGAGASVGQPDRFRHVRRALNRHQAVKDAGDRLGGLPDGDHR